MNTVWFIETQDDQNGFQLSSRNFKRAPRGRIHIARYETGFWPEHGLGYYGDTYFRAFIRVWKYKTALRVQRRAERRSALLLVKHTKLFSDVLSQVDSFL